MLRHREGSDGTKTKKPCMNLSRAGEERTRAPSPNATLTKMRSRIRPLRIGSEGRDDNDPLTMGRMIETKHFCTQTCILVEINERMEQDMHFGLMQESDYTM